jgi:transcriptional regulator of acetoin/glycerol metabolism
VGHDLRRRGIHCYELCRTTAHSRREITLVFAALAERASRARFVRWLTDRLGSPTHYKPVQLQYSGGLTEEFMKALVLHSWPGNVRELQNVIERSVILSTSGVLSGLLPELPRPTQDVSKWSKISMPITLLDGQISHILQTLQETKGVIGGRNGAAVRLGMARTTLIYRMKRLGIKALSPRSGVAI